MALQSNERPELQGEYLVVFVMDKIVKHLFGNECSFVPQNNDGNQVPYPYVTFLSAISHEYTTADHMSNQYYVEYEFACHHPNEFIAKHMATDLLEALTNDRGYEPWFEQVHLVPSPLDGHKSDVKNYTFLAGINYDNAFGFNYRFTIDRAQMVYQEKDLDWTYEKPIIRSVKANESTDGKNTSVSEKKEEN